MASISGFMERRFSICSISSDVSTAFEFEGRKMGDELVMFSLRMSSSVATLSRIFLLSSSKTSTFH